MREGRRRPPRRAPPGDRARPPRRHRLARPASTAATADPLPMMTLFDKQIQLRMGQANVRRWVDDILPLLDRRRSARRRRRSPPTTCRWPRRRAAYEMFQKKQDGAIKVVLRPDLGHAEGRRRDTLRSRTAGGSLGCPFSSLASARVGALGAPLRRSWEGAEGWWRLRCELSRGDCGSRRRSRTRRAERPAGLRVERRGVAAAVTEAARSSPSASSEVCFGSQPSSRRARPVSISGTPSARSIQPGSAGCRWARQLAEAAARRTLAGTGSCRARQSEAELPAGRSSARRRC